MNKGEIFLAEKYNKKYCVYTGNGTTAMYLAFRAFRGQAKKILFPAISCTNPVNAAIYAGYDVDFCDVKLDDYTMDTNHLQQMLQTGQFGVVVPTHLYGHRCADRVFQLCEQYGVLVLEDSAQTVSVGSSDVSIMSFGHTKIIQSHHGGGIALCDSEHIYDEMVREKAKLPSKSPNAPKLFDAYRESYYAIMNGNKTENLKYKNLRELQLSSKNVFIYDDSCEMDVGKIFEGETDIYEQRKKKASLYLNGLNRQYIICPNIEPQDVVPWRMSFLYKGNRKELLKRVRNEGIDISSWYPSLARIYNEVQLEKADTVASQIINLWVDESHSCDQIVAEITVINEIMEELHERYDKGAVDKLT